MTVDRSAIDIEKGIVRQSTGCTSTPSTGSAPTSSKSASSSLARLWPQRKTAREDPQVTASASAEPTSN
jgi:hypothetical protein